MGLSSRLIAAALLISLSGCTPHKFLTPGELAPVAPGSVVAAWSPKINYVPDPARGGSPAPGIAGRIYVFGQSQDFPIVTDGSIVIDLYDDTPVNGQPGNHHLEQWQFDPVTLRRLLKRDTVGMGYTVFLPWGTHRPDIKTVHLTLKFEPAKGSAIYAPSGPLTLDHGTAPVGTVR
ncbi:MAG: hypothetical protein K1X57_00230 [Gemmataceae bacterium]|nr:hypothetical protein [Gemmataceae bacterium]